MRHFWLLFSLGSLDHWRQEPPRRLAVQGRAGVCELFSEVQKRPGPSAEGSKPPGARWRKSEFPAARTLLWASRGNHGVEDRGSNALVSHGSWCCRSWQCQLDRNNRMGLAGFAKGVLQQATTCYVEGTSASDKKSAIGTLFCERCRWEKEFQLFLLSDFPRWDFWRGRKWHSLLPCLWSGRFVSSWFNWKFWGLCAGDRTISVRKSST